MTVTSATSAAFPAGTSSKVGKGLSSLDQGDFLRLMTTQMQQQDPFDPVDQKEMLAQMAQFSSLGGINDTNAILEKISSKLDLLASAQQAGVTTQES